MAETCAPFEVLQALMNEYSVLELNIQNGVLKAMGFMFEYIGEMGKDYIYVVTSLLKDALTDRDAVHYQTGCTTVKHLGVVGLGNKDTLIHLLNFFSPNIFEESAHVIQETCNIFEGLMVSLGPNFGHTPCKVFTTPHVGYKRFIEKFTTCCTSALQNRESLVFLSLRTRGRTCMYT